MIVITEPIDDFSIDALAEVPKEFRLDYVWQCEASLHALRPDELDRITTLITGIRLVTIGL